MTKKKVTLMAVVIVVLAAFMLYCCHILFVSIHEIGNEILVNEYHQEPNELDEPYMAYIYLLPVALILSIFMVCIFTILFKRYMKKNEL